MIEEGQSFVMRHSIWNMVTTQQRNCPLNITPDNIFTYTRPPFFFRWSIPSKSGLCPMAQSGTDPIGAVGVVGELEEAPPPGPPRLRLD